MITVAEKTLRAIVLAGIFALPAVALIVANGLFFPYITGKNFAFRIIVEIIASAWLALAFIVPQYRPRRSWILGSFALFVFIIAIADAQGAYPFKSFWSNYERMDGWITIAHTLLLLVVSVSVLHTENLWRRLLQWSLVVSAILSVLGFMQVAGIMTLGSGGTGLTGRVDATFGNPIYFAVYMLFHIFIAALLWYQMWVVRGKGKRLAPSILYGFAMIIDTLALLSSGTRGAILGLIAGGILSLVLFALSSNASQRVRQMTIGAIAMVIMLGAILFMARDAAIVHKIGFLGRLSSISLQDGTTKARFYNMGMALEGVKERPIFGWGQENYALVFDKYYDPRMYAQEQWFDRVHNIIFDWWVAGGTLGLLSYLSIFAATLWILWRRNAFARAESSILTGLLAGYFVHNLTVFDNVTSYILFATVLGYVAYRENLVQKIPLVFDQEIIPRSMLPAAVLVAIAMAWGSAWMINSHAYAANKALINAIMPQADVAKNLDLFKKAIAYDSYGTQEAREQLAQISMQIVRSEFPDSIKKQFVEMAVRELDLQAESSPLDARFPLFAGAVLGTAGAYRDAHIELEKAHKLSLGKQTILFQLAQNAQLQGDKASMVKYFGMAYDLFPDYLDARIYYAAALIRAGNDKEADAILAPILASGKAADPRITEVYVSRGQFNKLIPIWQAHVQAEPSDIQGYFTLAAAYYSAKDHAASIAVLREIGKIATSVKPQADQYILQIQSGVVPGQ